MFPTRLFRAAPVTSGPPRTPTPHHFLSPQLPPPAPYNALASLCPWLLPLSSLPELTGSRVSCDRLQASKYLPLSSELALPEGDFPSAEDHVTSPPREPNTPTTP